MKKKAVFLVKEVMDRHKEVYSEEECKLYCPQIFQSNVLKSIKDVPEEYLDSYFKNYTEIKNIRNMHTNVVKELIDANYIK